MLEYDIIETDQFEFLIELVNKRIKEGWRPQGGINIGEHVSDDRDVSDAWYAQAMVREIPEEKENG